MTSLGLTYSPSTPDVSLQPAARWQIRWAPFEVVFVAAFLYLAQRKGNLWMTAFCVLEFAALIASFIAFYKRKTRKRANLFSMCFNAVVSVTVLIDLLYFKH